MRYADPTHKDGFSPPPRLIGCQWTNILAVLNMPCCIFFILGFSPRALSSVGYLDLDEPFDGLKMTQGMVCHQTFKTKMENGYFRPKCLKMAINGLKPPLAPLPTLGALKK